MSTTTRPLAGRPLPLVLLLTGLLLLASTSTAHADPTTATDSPTDDTTATATDTAYHTSAAARGLACHVARVHYREAWRATWVVVFASARRPADVSHGEMGEGVVVPLRNDAGTPMPTTASFFRGGGEHAARRICDLGEETASKLTNATFFGAVETWLSPLTNDTRRAVVEGSNYGAPLLPHEEAELEEPAGGGGGGGGGGASADERRDAVLRFKRARRYPGPSPKVSMYSTLVAPSAPQDHVVIPPHVEYVRRREREGGERESLAIDSIEHGFLSLSTGPVLHCPV